MDSWWNNIVKKIHEEMMNSDKFKVDQKAYKEKLNAFNSTNKYKQEYELLKWLLNPKQNEKILDYGCGTGHVMRNLMSDTNATVFGYDVTDELYEGDPFYFKKSVWFEINKYYFMHSLAHIPNIEEVLRNQVYMSKGCIVVITPNRLWIEQQDSRNYTPDPTVFRHYSQKELKALFELCGYEIEMIGQFGSETNGFNERIFLKALKH